MTFYLNYMLPPALVLFVAPCLLPWRWLCGYVPLAAIGIAAIWVNHWAHRYEGNGAAVALGEIIILYGTLAAIVGVLARVAVLLLRTWRIQWRYAVLPVPALLVLLLAAPWLLMLYSAFEDRPPPDECLLATHRLELAGALLSIPPAPVFIVVPAGQKEPYNLARPDKARAFCRMVKRSQPSPIQRLSLDLERQGPLYRHHWHPLLCSAIRHRAWMHRLCEGPRLAEQERYPQWLSLAPSEQMTPGSYADIWTLLQRPAEPIPQQRDARRILQRLRADDGTPVAAGCWLFNKGRAECDAVFEPRPGLAAQFRVSVPRDRMAAELIAVQARVAEIVRDLQID